ncbi:PDZ domain containing protein [Aphelenchoides besseyi]|nr:PDZ domain containing protein [Aphelenchoides besseyi]
MKKRPFKSSRESNESKQQSRDQLATQIEPKIPDDERIRAVLRELRLKNINLDAGLERLERLIHSDEPESRKFVEEIKQQSKIGRKDIRVELEIERCKLHIVPLIAEKIGPHQKLIFGAVNFQDGNFPDLYVSGDCSSLAIVGPRGIKKRTNGALRIADHVVSINNLLVSDLLRNSRADGSVPAAVRSLQFVYAYLIQATSGPSATLIFGVLRDTVDPIMALTGDLTQVELIHLPNDRESGLGFGIVGGASTGVVIKTILPGSAADKDGRLKAGDRLLQIGRINVQGMSSQQVATLLRQHDDVIELIVGRPISLNEQDNVDTATRWTMGTKTALTPATLEEHIQSRIAAAAAAANRESDTTSNELVNPTTETTEAIIENGKEETSKKESGNSLNCQSQQLPSSSDSKQSGVPVSRTNSTHPSKSPSTERPMSLKSLQEMALTTFCSENWVQDKYEIVQVELDRDPTLGLGITVAGYVHKKEEITGIFVKSLVPNSSAHLSKSIQVHDLIIEVNDRSLEKRKHADAVRMLVKSGPKARLRMIRFHPESPQAVCLKMLHEQESATHVRDVQSNLIDYKKYWETKLGSDYEIVQVDLIPDKHQDEDAGLGLSLEGTVDIVNGASLCPHHYIESLRKDGPASKTGLLKAGDELLQVNESILFSESHVTVRQELGKAATAATERGGEVRLFLCRKAQQAVNLYMPSPQQSLPLAYPLLAAAHDDRLFKAKSEFTLTTTVDSEGVFFRSLAKKLRSRSLEQLSGLAIWNCVPIVVCLEKDSRGLGFSIIDYQDPLHHNESVIVVRSLVPGGVAQADGRIVPGDRLLFVNSEDLSSSTLQHAVEVLKAAPSGLVRIGIAKPVPINELNHSDHLPIITPSERLLAKGTSPRTRRKRLALGSDGQLNGSHLLDTNTLASGTSSQEEVWIGADLYRRLNPQLYFPSSGSGTPTTPRSHCSMFSWTPCSSRSVSPVGSPVSLKGSWSYDVVNLPSHLERSIKIMKGALPLGIVIDADVDKSINGCVVKSICSKKAVGRDGRIQVGDYIVRMNTESLRNVTNAQARTILKRTNLIGTQCNLSYITASDARIWRQHIHRDSEPQPPVVNRLSPKVFPKFYQSPFLSRRNDQMTPRAMALRNQLSQDSFDERIMPCTSTAESCRYPNDELTQTTLSQLSEDCRKRMDELAEEFVRGVLEGSAAELAAYYRTPDWSSGKQREAQQRRLSEQSKKSETSSKIGNRVRMKTPKQSMDEEDRSQSSPLPSPPPMEMMTPPTLAKSVKIDESSNTSAPSNIELPRKPSNGDLVHNRQQTEETETRKHPNVKSLPSVDTITSTTSSINRDEQTTSSSQTAKRRSNFWGDARNVVLNREPHETFGISIVGGRVEVSQKGGLPGNGSTVSGIFIKSVLPDSPAGRSSKMFMGDRVISVNDVDLRNATHEQAVQAIKNARNPVRFVVQSLQSFSPDRFSRKSPGGSDEPLHQQKVEIVHQRREVQSTSSAPLTATEPMELHVTDKIEERKVTIRPEIPPKPVIAPKPTITCEPSTSTADSAPRRPLAELRESMRRKVEPESAAALEKTVDDEEEEDRFCYTEKKIQHKYGNLPGTPTLIRLQNIPPNGLGLSLAGESKKVFIVDVKSTSPLPLLVGDELLEINGRVLFGLSHQSATTKIRECCDGDELALLILRPSKPQTEEPKPENPLTTPVTKLKGEDPSAGNQAESLAPKLSLPADLHNNNTSNNKLGPIANHSPSSLHDVSQTITTLQSSPGHMDTNRRKKSWQMERTAISAGTECLIEIDKDGKGLGLSVVGGSDTVLGSIVIHEVYPDGAAATDGRLQPGDQVLEVNGTSLSGLNHDQAITILRRTPAKVRLLVYRDVNLQLSLLDPTQLYNIHEIEIHKKAGRGFGIGICGRKDEPGVYISEIVKGGVAEADGRLLQGDQILAVNGQDVATKMQEDVATLLKTISGKVTIKVGRWKLNDAANRIQASRPSATSSAVASPQLQRPSPTTVITIQQPSTSGLTQNTNSTTAEVPVSNGTAIAPTISTKTVVPGEGDEDRRVPSPAPLPSFGGYMAMAPQDVPPEPQRLSNELSPVTEEPGSNTDLKSLAEPAEIALLDIHEEGSEDHLIPLKKDDGHQWGMGIGKRPRGILITSLQPGSTAAEKLVVGDRIMAVNGVAITDQHSAVTHIKLTKNQVVLQISRPTSTQQGF